MISTKANFHSLAMRFMTLAVLGIIAAHAHAAEGFAGPVWSYDQETQGNNTTVSMNSADASFNLTHSTVTFPQWGRVAYGLINGETIRWILVDQTLYSYNETTHQNRPTLTLPFSAFTIPAPQDIFYESGYLWSTKYEAVTSEVIVYKLNPDTGADVGNVTLTIPSPYSGTSRYDYNAFPRANGTLGLGLSHAANQTVVYLTYGLGGGGHTALEVVPRPAESALAPKEQPRRESFGYSGRGYWYFRRSSIDISSSPAPSVFDVTFTGFFSPRTVNSFAAGRPAGYFRQYKLSAITNCSFPILPPPLPTVTVVATDATAAEYGGDTGTFTFTRTGSTGSALTVNFTVVNNAVNGVDFTSIGTSVTIPAGSATATKQIVGIEDNLVEGTEKAEVLISANSAYVVGSPSSDSVMLLDNSRPLVSVSATDASATEGADGATFTLTRVGANTTALTVSLSTAGTATSGSDFTALPTTATFAAGASSVAVPLTSVDDAVAEASETVILTITSGAAYRLGSPVSATATIIDNEQVVSVSASDATASEPGSDAGALTFTRVGSTVGALTVSFSVSGSATSGIDFTALGTSVVIPAGSTSVVKSVAVLDDTAIEPAETVVVTLVANAAYIIGSSTTGTVTIQDNDTPVITLTGADSATEGADTATFTFSRTGATTLPVTFQIAWSGSAVNGVDFSTLGTSVTIPAGSSTVGLTLVPVDDAIYESDELATASIVSGSGYIVGGASSLSAKLYDNDLPAVTIQATNAVAGEPTNKGVFTLTRSGYTGLAQSASLTYGGTATSGSDYTALPATVTFTAGSATAVITATPIDDAIAEADETIVATVAAGSGYVVGSPSSATVKLVDNEQTVSVVATDASAQEPSDTGTFTISRVGNTSSALTVAFAISGTATSGTDFTALPASVTIPVGSASTAIVLAPIDDAVYEGSEKAILTISANAAYVIATPSSAVTLKDDDLPSITIQASGVLASEPSTSGSFTLTRTGFLDEARTVNLTVGGTATAGADYAALPATVTFASGSATAGVQVAPIDDAAVEPAESVIATVSAGTGYAVGSPSSATVAITDDEPSISVAASDAAASEAAGNPGAFTFTRGGSVAAAMTVNFTVTGTATAGTDYTAFGATVVIPAGAVVVTVPVTPIEDSAYEGPETVVLTLAAGSYGILGPASAIVNIQDNDLPGVSIAAPDAAASEAGTNNGTFRVSRSGITSLGSLAVTLAYSGQAVPGSDFVALATIVTIPVNQAFVDLTLTPYADEAIEGPETAVATVQSNAAYVITGGSATITINAASNVISTIAGNGGYGPGVPGPALSTALGTPSGVAVDASGNRFIADADNNAIYKVTPAGTLSVFAGTGTGGFSGDGGSATAANLNGPAGVAVDGSGTVYIADTFNNRIRKVVAGVISTCAGTGAGRFGGDGGQASVAFLKGPNDVAVDAAGNLLIADTGNQRIRKVVIASGVISTIAGGGTGGDGGQANLASLATPSGVAADGAGNVYIAETAANRVRKVAASGVISTIAGTGLAGFSGDGGSAAAAQLNGPDSVAVDEFGDVVIVDTQNHCVRRVAGGIITTIAGNGTAVYAGDGGPAASASLYTPLGAAFSPNGSLFIADGYNGVVRKVQSIPTGIGANIRVPMRAGGATTGLLSRPAGIPGV